MPGNTNVATIEPAARRSVVADVAHRYGMEADTFEATLRKTVVKGDVSREEFAALMVVANQYGLNPLTKELYAFPAKGGGIQPIVSIDGWARIINDHPAFDGMEFEDVLGDGSEVIAITCRMYRKDRAKPVECTEYMAECKRGTDVWKTWPRRMLRHKAMIQCARYAFGFGGIVDQDEYERTAEATAPATRPDVRQRLEERGEGEREGFSAARAVEVVDELTGEVIEVEAEAIDPPAPDELPVRDDTPPEEAAAAAEPAEPAEAEPASIESLGLKTGSELAAEQEASKDGPKATDADKLTDDEIRDWAASFNRGLAQLNTVEDVAGAWKTAKQNGMIRRLKRTSEALAGSLADAVNARVAEINKADV